MSRSGADGWRSLQPADLHHLKGVWSACTGGKPIDPHLLWWDLTRGRHFAPRGDKQKLPVLVEADDVAALDQHGLEHRPVLQSASNRVGCGFVEPDRLPFLIAAAHRVELGLAAVPEAVLPEVPPLHATATQLPLIGFIDDGCAFLHPCFAGAKGDLRVRWLWDQGERKPDGDLWGPSGFFYGAELTAAGFARARAAAKQGGEAAGYRAIGYLVDAAGQVLSKSHGTHVAGLAAGRVEALPPWCARRDGGAASQADIAIVTLPAKTLADSSGRSLAMHVLNGVRYILSKAAPKQPVAINLSLGHHGGPHDGSDILTQGLSDLMAESWTATRPLVLVTGAGNSFESATHAHWLEDSCGLPYTRTAYSVWEVPPADLTDSFLNVWSPAKAPLHLTVKDPDERCCGVVQPGHATVLWRAGTPVAMAANLQSSANGAGSHIHIAVAPTQVLDGGPTGPAGDWLVTLKNENSQPCPFDIWIDRDDAPYGPYSAPRAPSRMRDVAGQPSVVSGERTLNALADPTHAVIAAACVLNTGTISDYSASGGGRYGNPTRLPLLTMPADSDGRLRGLPGPGTIGGGPTQSIGGTSVSSALLTREVVDLISRTKPANWQQLLDSLKKGLLGGPYSGDLRLGAGRTNGRLCRP